MSSSRFAPLLTLGAMALAGVAGARPPAYTLNAGVTTSLHNVAAGKLHEECFDDDCNERGGVVVAEGETEGDVKVAVKIREYRDRKGATGKDLEALARKSQARLGDSDEIRLVSASVQSHPIVEQWTKHDPCEPELAARLLIAFPDKIVEIETTAEPDLDHVSDAFSQMDHILRGLRIRRAGDATLDPAPALPEDVAKHFGDGC